MTAGPNLEQFASKAVRQAVQALDRTHCRLARVDPNAFNTYVLRDEERNTPILQSAIHEQWHRQISLNSRALIWAHVEAGKTTQLTLGRTLYELGKNTSLRIAIVSNTDAQAQKVAMTIGKYITGSPELKRVFPHLERDRSMPWTMHHLFVKRSTRSRDPSVRTCGIHGNILGSRIDLLILDDLLDYENTISKTQRDDLYNWYMSTLETRLTRNARVWCVGTAWHRDDFMHRIAKSAMWSAKRYPVIDDQGRPTWPDKWPLERIEQKRSILGPLEFSRQLQCVARSDEDSRFKREWIENCVKRGAGKSLIHAFAEVPPGYRTYTGVDLGVSTKDGADLTVIFTIAVHPNGDRQVVDIQAGRFSGDEILRRIRDTHNRYRSIVTVESNAAQMFITNFTKQLVSNTGNPIPVQPYFTSGKTFRSYEFGIESMAVEMANEKWIIPSTDGTINGCHPEVQAWVSELLYYDPRTHPGDRLMASWFAREGAGKTKPKAQVGRIDLLRR